jgi:hypothetical protein
VFTLKKVSNGPVPVKKKEDNNSAQASTAQFIGTVTGEHGSQEVIHGF